MNRKNLFNLDICTVLVNDRQLCRHNDLVITLKYVLTFLLGTMKILLIFLIAISRRDLFTETIRSFNLFYFFNLCSFPKISKTALWIFLRLSLCILDVVNNVSSKFRYDWLSGKNINSAIKMAAEGTEIFALQSHDWLFFLIYSICTTFFRVFPSAHFNANLSYSLR